MRTTIARHHLLTCAVALTIAFSFSVAWSDDLQTWIATNAVSVRSIDATDEDFSDLDPLMKAIGTAEVVQLGEVSHGAGNSFSAKVRLIKFLHQRMGFDVLVWESGMHGMRQAQAAMRAGDDAVTAGQQGVFPIWSHAEEVRPLFEYVKASQSSNRPLEMAGFDMQFTAPKAAEHFAADLRALVAAVPQPATRRQAQELVEQALTSHNRLQDPKLEAKSEELEKLRNSTGALLKLIADQRARFEQIHGSRETSFMECTIENLRADGEAKLDLSPVSTSPHNAGFRDMDAYFNRRDGQNARNFRWLVEKGYPGRKIIVWAHNAHITYAHIGSRFSNIDVEAQPGDLKPTGAYLHEWLGRKVYTIGLTTFEGNDGWVSSAVPVPLPPVMKDSLESHLHAVGKPYLFLDLRRLDMSPTHPLRKPQSMRVFIPVVGADTAAPAQGSYTIDDITRIFDGVFYIDQTTPATRLSSRHPASATPSTQDAVPPKAAKATGAIEQVILGPVFADRYLCVEHTLELEYAGDALGIDCVVSGGVEIGANGFLKLYRTDGKTNADWYGWHANVLAPFDGTVIYISPDGKENVPGILGPSSAAGSLRFRNEAGVIVVYAHATEIAVKVGDTVKAGQVIAKLGNNGQTRAPGIHIGAYREADLVPLQIRWDLRAMANARIAAGVK